MIRRRGVLICCVIVPIVSFALAQVHPFGDAGLNRPQASQSSIGTSVGVPREVRSILIEKCADCHSNQSRAPLYSRFAPISWLLERDVVHARKAMNLSLWASYPEDKRQALMAQIAHEAVSGAMPPPQYRMIHWGSRITESDLRAFAQLKQLSAQSGGTSSQWGTGDPSRGKELFEKRCTGCHSLATNHEGPRLQTVFGRTAGSLADFAYSRALKNAHVVWDETSLDRWLTDPDAFFPGNEMDFLVSNRQERRDIISYLRQNSGR